MSGLTDTVKVLLPAISTAFGGPLAGLAAEFIAGKLGVSDKTVDNITTILAGAGPDKLVELKRIELDFQARMAELGYANVQAIEELNVRAVEAVNKTMQAETASEHWPSYSWRPAIGFAFAFNIVLSTVTVTAAYIMAVFLNRVELLKELPGILGALAAISATAAPVLGIASWFRGKMQADPQIPTVNRG